MLQGPKSKNEQSGLHTLAHVHTKNIFLKQCLIIVNLLKTLATIQPEKIGKREKKSSKTAMVAILLFKILKKKIILGNWALEKFVTLKYLNVGGGNTSSKDTTNKSTAAKIT